ncbi:mycothiol system anti-sigma-R factor [Antrihabitans sp. NCIMB 15449]|uniref:Mycothiol system anti-sigma-R factor n=1 Tax=Antrihabitans spumae TaxID=3373370 RepID=A0ABW7JT16_9NOCA
MSEQDDYKLDCTAVIADVWLMLDNEGDQATRERLQYHLDTCGTCLEQYGIEEQIKGLLSRKCGGERAPEGLRQRLSIEIRRTVVIRTEAE